MNSLGHASSRTSPEPYGSAGGSGFAVDSSLLPPDLLSPSCDRWALAEESDDDTDPDMPQMLPVLPSDVQRSFINRQGKTTEFVATMRTRSSKRRRFERCSLPNNQKLPRKGDTLDARVRTVETAYLSAVLSY
jgi:hypothetical protein